jgi:hypothetical protein
MAEKQKEGKAGAGGRQGGEEARPGGRRPAGGAAGRIAVRREAAPYRRAAVEEHSQQVRQRIEAALANGRRLREDIEGRIDEQLAREEGGEVAKIVTEVTARARGRPGKGGRAEGEGEGRSRGPR